MNLLRILFVILNKFLGWFLLLLLVFLYKIRINVPDVDHSLSPASFQRIKVGENHYRVKNCWLRKNEQQVWEMYLEGSPYERGLIYGVLAKEIVVSQEKAFVDQINTLIPGSFFQRMVEFFVVCFNCDMDEDVNSENMQEIYGISQSFADEYDYIGPKFFRILYYHAAHDIGHALADLRIVGCTSFAVKNAYSSDGELLIGRNFDFYMGEEFARDKLLLFLKPDKGYAFSTCSWAGFTGVVSGMNEKGLTVTLNAAQSEIPLKARKPISLLAREILQYASNIKEATEIARNSHVFVSESILIGSAADSAAVLIEKGPAKMDVYSSNSDALICSNHYQGKAFTNDKGNKENLRWSDSKERFSRMQQLVENHKPMNYLGAAEILRDKDGLNNKKIGLGNQKAVNQLIAHHAIIFKPATRQFWISTYPYQLGPMLAYDLNKIFATKTPKSIDSLSIPADPFLYTQEYSAYLLYRKQKEQITRNLLFHADFTLSQTEIDQFIASNPNSYEVYKLVGGYYEMKQLPKQAEEMYKLALTKEVASPKEIEQIKANQEHCIKLQKPGKP